MMAGQTKAPDEASVAAASIGINDLVSKYGSYRRATHKNAILVFVVSVALAVLSRTPAWSTNEVSVIGLPLRLASGFMPICGPVVIYLLYLYFYCGFLDALGLRRAAVERLGEKGRESSPSTPERELLKAPLQVAPAPEADRITRTTARVAANIICFGPLVCYVILLWDFCTLELSDPVIGSGYELFWTFHGWKGIKVASHLGVGNGLPPVFPIWQPWLYATFLAHLTFLAMDVARRILGPSALLAFVRPGLRRIMLTALRCLR